MTARLAFCFIVLLHPAPRKVGAGWRKPVAGVIAVAARCPTGETGGPPGFLTVRERPGQAFPRSGVGHPVRTRTQAGGGASASGPVGRRQEVSASGAAGRWAGGSG
ncbi:hypothetical protein GCM10010151_61430 [Actinoallomurus spadix]|uniref:Secreted protein n=1 Tax=Actinoallomurus spadix TaxID=79912 RepID=A0ABN0XFT5_9ACTN